MKIVQLKTRLIGWQKGSTLIEILIATAVVGTILTAVTLSLTYSIKTTAEARYRAVATQKAQEAMEMFRRERDLLGWDEFYSTLSADAYCLATLPTAGNLASLSSGGCGGSYGLEVTGAGISFRREANLVDSGDGLEITVTVDWQDAKVATGYHRVTVIQELKDWQ